jgi:hypothetical protein
MVKRIFSVILFASIISFSGVSSAQDLESESGFYFPRFGIGFFTSMASSNELMIGQGVLAQFRINKHFAIAGSFEILDFMLESDCGYHRNSSNSIGISTKYTPLGLYSQIRFRPYIKGGLIYQNLYLGGTDTNPTPPENFDYDTKALLAEFGAGVDLYIKKAEYGGISISLNIELITTYPIIEPGTPKCACDCIEIPDGKSIVFRAGVNLHF